MMRRVPFAARMTAAAMVVAGCAACTSNVEMTNTIPEFPDNCAANLPPSGQSVPTTDVYGWKQIFTDDFDRCELGPKWSVYTGRPGGNPLGWWDPSMVSLRDGVLELRSERGADGWVNGGVSNYPVTQQYGRWEIRMRADHSDDISYHMLLWPQNEQWPPEIDFAESVSGDRSQMDAFLHWVDADGDNAKKGVAVSGDFSQWHNVGVEWGPGFLRYILDGEVWAETRSEQMIPTVPMWLGMQVEAGACERRVDWGHTPCSADPKFRQDDVTVEIDWVSVSQPVTDQLTEMLEAGALRPNPEAIQLTGE